MKTRTRNEISVKLVTEISRIVTLNDLSLPKVKLLGAIVSILFMSKVKIFLNLKRIYFLYLSTDIKIILLWIRSIGNHKRNYVANRFDKKY